MTTEQLAKRFFPHLLPRHAICCVEDVLKFTFPIRNDAPGVTLSQRWFSVRNQADDSKPVEILIYDQIGKDWFSNDGIAAKDFAETLRGIPVNREITVRLNSPGGNVFDGHTIYNLLKARRDRVTCIVDGVAASIASIIAMAGKELRVPKNALLMVHQPTWMTGGTAQDHRTAADTLDKFANQIADVYAEKTKRPRADMLKLMDATTWMTGEEAKKEGFCDCVDEAVTIAAKFDFSKFDKVPQTLLTHAAANNGVADSTKPQNPMNRTQIIALLNRLGIQFEANATDEQLATLLNSYQPPTPANTATPTPPVAPAPAPANADPNAALTAQVQALNARAEREQRDRVTRAVDQAILETRIPAAQRDRWVTRAMADETVLNDLAAIDPHPPGVDPVPMAAITSESIPDIVRHFVTLQRPQAAFAQTFRLLDAREQQDIRNSAMQTALHYRQNRDRLLQVLNTNTIPAGLQRNAILQETMTAFAPVILALNAFSTRFENVPLEGTNKVEVAYYPLQTAASTAFNGTYAVGNTTTEVLEVEITKRQTMGLAFTSSELRRQPYLNIVKLGQMNAAKLALDVFTDVLSIVTVANYGASVLAELPSAFDTDDIADLAETADTLEWPTGGRSLILLNTYLTPLRKAKALTSVADSGTAETLRDGTVGRLSGFDIYSTPRMPANSENLRGMICHKSAIAVATAPILPAPGVRKNLVSYEVVIDPATGIAFEYRYWGEPTTDTDTEIIECNYGYAKLEGAALRRITSQ